MIKSAKSTANKGEAKATKAINAIKAKTPMKVVANQEPYMTARLPADPQRQTAEDCSGSFLGL
jgi:hypothetical protein